MAKILYGVSGEGFGHAARSKEVIAHLQQVGHQVKVLSYDRGHKWLSQYFAVEPIFGLNFTYQNNEVKYLETVFNNFLKTPGALRSIDKVLSIIDDFEPDLVFTDFEPAVAVAANLKRLPLVSLDNQHVMTKTDAELPSAFSRQALVAKLITRLFVLKASRYLVLSFFPATAVDAKTKVLPPLLRSEILSLQPTHNGPILVYLTSPADNLVQVLKRVKAEFVVYGLEKEGIEGQITYKNYNPASFLADLNSCAAIVANAGFSLISEAIYLKKPYLAVPAKAQYEQLLNAWQLDRLGYGVNCPDLGVEALRDFLFQLDFLRQRLAAAPSFDNQTVFTAVDETVKQLLP